MFIRLFTHLTRATPCRALFSAVITAVFLLSGCVIPTKTTQTPVVGPSAEELVNQQRLERANANLSEGLKRFDAGNYDESIRSFLLALDSGVLTLPQQISARKNMAFIHCLSNREAACKDEFERSLALDAQFDLTPAEAGHPTWGPVFRQVRMEIDLRKSRRTALPTPKPPTAAEKLLAEGVAAYDVADYNKAIKSFQDAIKETISDDDKIRALKLTAFSYCLSSRIALCRAEFEKILHLKPGFELEPAEAGHPSWGPSFRNAKSKQKVGAAVAPAAPQKNRILSP